MNTKLKLWLILAIILVSSTGCDKMQANEIARLTKENEELNANLEEANLKLARIDSVQDSMYQYADSVIAVKELQIINLNGQISLLNDELIKSNNNLEDLLTRINNDIILNIDSIYVRINRNYKELTSND